MKIIKINEMIIIIIELLVQNDLYWNEMLIIILQIQRIIAKVRKQIGTKLNHIQVFI